MADQYDSYDPGNDPRDQYDDIGKFPRAKVKDKDCERIVQLAKKNGFNIDEEQAKALWLRFSDDVCATWLTLPEEDKILYECIEPFLKGKLPSKHLAGLIVDALLDAKIIKEEDFDKAVEIAQEEINVRKSLGDY